MAAVSPESVDTVVDCGTFPCHGKVTPLHPWLSQPGPFGLLHQLKSLLEVLVAGFAPYSPLVESERREGVMKARMKIHFRLFIAEIPQLSS